MITLTPDMIEYLGLPKAERIAAWNAAGIEQRGRYQAAEINKANAWDDAANQDQGRAWALRHLNGECDSRGTCQPVPASAERPANLDFFEWVGALWCDEREAHSTMMGMSVPDVAPDRPLNLRVASMSGVGVHRPSPKGDAEPLRDGLCSVRARLTDFVELTTDPVDCPVCLALELAEHV